MGLFPKIVVTAVDVSHIPKWVTVKGGRIVIVTKCKTMLDTCHISLNYPSYLITKCAQCHE
mgnify:CR=1 FL=1